MFNPAFNNGLWKKACHDEFEALEHKKTWEECDLPPGRKAIPTKWHLKVKGDKVGKVSRFKGRVVVRAFDQIEGIDFNETFSPVAGMTAIRLFLAIAAHKKWRISQLDVKTAFLNSSLDEEIYIELPEGYDEFLKSKGKILNSKFARLNKSLYGLKQAPLCWYKTITNKLLSLGYKPCVSEPCMFVKTVNGKQTLLVLYVDDVLLSGDDAEMIATDVNELNDEFTLVFQEEADFILGVEIEQTENHIKLNQQQYIERKGKEFGCLSTETYTPMATSFQFDEDEDEFKCCYREIIGSLMYAAQCTRPDIAYAVSKLSQKLYKPTKTNLAADQRVLDYLHTTKDARLAFPLDDDPAGNALQISTYADDSCAPDAETCKSDTGSVILIDGNLVAWKSKKQPVVSLSSSEAEMHALVDLVREIDNNSTIKMIENTTRSLRTKHIAKETHFVKSYFTD